MSTFRLPPLKQKSLTAATIVDEASFENVVRLEEARRVATEKLYLAGVRLNVVRRSKGRSLKHMTEDQELQAYAVVEEKRKELVDAEAALNDGLAHRKMVLAAFV